MNKEVKEGGLHDNEATRNIYEFITQNDDNACEAIPDSACRQAPGNFMLNALNGTFTKLAEQIASPSLVLPWLLSALGAPSSLSGFLVPVSRGGSLLPQLSISGRIRKFEVRKWFWAVAGFTQAVALILMALSALFFKGLAAGIAILVFLAIFSMASGVGSVSFKDVMAKTIPKGKRGTLLSVRATAGGILALGAGVVIHTGLDQSEDVALYVFLLFAAAFLWFIAAIFFSFIREYPGATEGSRNAISEAKAGWNLLLNQKAFARFVMARAFLLGVILVVPFYAIFARKVTGTEFSSLALFVIANSLATVLSSYFWGRFADRSSRRVLAAGGIVGLLSCMLALSFLILPENWQNPYAFSVVFFVAGFSHTGIRLGRKTYLIDAAPEKERPLYVAVSNTLVGLITLLSAVLGFSADQFGVSWLIALFGAGIAVGIVLALTLPEASNMVQSSHKFAE